MSFDCTMETPQTFFKHTKERGTLMELSVRPHWQIKENHVTKQSVLYEPNYR